jgi:hypothetical protein
MRVQRGSDFGAERPAAMLSKRRKLLGGRALATERYESFRFVHSKNVIRR